MTEKEVRDIVKNVLKSQMTDVPTKSEVKKIAKEEAKNFMTEKEVKEMIKKTMLSYHKWMWEKKGMWMSQI
jgi:ethanolamine ammonia-lyase small subunit